MRCSVPECNWEADEKSGYDFVKEYQMDAHLAGHNAAQERMRKYALEHIDEIGVFCSQKHLGSSIQCSCVDMIEELLLIADKRRLGCIDYKHKCQKK